MLSKILGFANGEENNNLPEGLGVAELPIEVFRGKQFIKSADFKKIVNDHFAPKIHELGFKGKDFFFYRENETYTEAVFFWTYRSGGAIAVDLLVRFNKIIYPDGKKRTPSRLLRDEDCEFHKRLSPNKILPKGKFDVWFWVFEEHLNENVKIVEDIWRLFATIGLEYFKRFENHQTYIRNITTENYIEFPDFQIARVCGRYETGIIYFLFEYWRQQGNETKALEFAKLGIEKLKSDGKNAYINAFKVYVET